MKFSHLLTYYLSNFFKFVGRIFFFFLMYEARGPQFAWSSSIIRNCVRLTFYCVVPVMYANTGNFRSHLENTDCSDEELVWVNLLFIQKECSIHFITGPSQENKAVVLKLPTMSLASLVLTGVLRFHLRAGQLKLSVAICALVVHLESRGIPQRFSICRQNQATVCLAQLQRQQEGQPTANCKLPTTTANALRAPCTLLMFHENSMLFGVS